MTKTTSEIAIVDENILANHASREMPNISSINVSKSTKVHIGPKIVAVNQTIENKEMIKGHIFGLELVSAKSARRLRCSVAVFLCWALLVASGLAVYLVSLAMHKQPVRLDIDLPLPKYIWSTLKNTSKAERLSCFAAIAALFVCIFLIIYYTTYAKTQQNIVEDVSPHEWRITREMWLARTYVSSELEGEFKPAKLVMIQHTVSPECHNFIKCAAEVRTMQNNFIDDEKYKYDIPYNFLIGNDGRVYEGRGWNIVGAHTRFYNRCSVGIGFIGDYREELPVYTKVTEAQMERFNLIIEEGVREGYIAADYYVVAAKDVQNSASPGDNLYKKLQTLEHYDHDHQFRNKTCPEIYGHD